MTTWIYLPVPSQEMRGFANDMKLGDRYTLSNYFASGKGKAITRFFGGCLGGVAPWDELLLICHGAALGSRLTGADRDDGSEKTYTPAALAAVIEKEGLSKAFVDLKLLICGSAVRPATGVDDPFAMRVCSAMKASGYSNLRVTGYLGNVTTDNGKILVARAGVDGTKYYAGNVPGSYKVYR